VIKIHTSDYQRTGVISGQGLPDSTFFLSDDPTSILVAKWTLDSKYRAHLLELSELVSQAGETPQKSTGINSSIDTYPKGK
jgi:hypothetical protein